jgi:uncharacterized membrane protein YcaP (DUF421 family)
MWDDMMIPGISVIEKMIRPLVVYAFLLVGIRLAGKRELAQLNAMDLVVLLTLSNTVQNAIIGNDNSLLGGLIGATTLLAVNSFTVRFLFSHKEIDKLVEGEPTVLVENGKVLEKQLQKELVTREELVIAAHKQGFASLDQVDKAVLEAGGVITFIGKQPTPLETRHRELQVQLDAIHRQLVELKSLVAGKA